MMGFLAALPFNYVSIKVQILSNLEISSFKETFSRILHTKISSPTLPSSNIGSALIDRNIGDSGKLKYINSGPGGNTREPSFGVVC